MKTGTLCVQDLDMLVADEELFKPDMGVIGLGSSSSVKDERSFI